MNITKSDTHTILTLHLSRDFKVPSFIQNETSSTIESILLQSQELFELQKSLTFKQSDQSLKSFYDQKVLEASLQAQKSYSSELNRWQQERSQLSQEIARLQIDLQEKVYQASKALESKNQELTGKLLAATSQISQLQDDRFDLEKRTREFVSQTFTSQIASIKEAHLRDSENLKGFIQSYKLDAESYRLKYDDLLSQKTKTSTKLGQIGELTFEDLCNDAGIQVTNTAKEGYKGDLLGVIGEHKILIEVKNYTYTVNSKEVIKFKRDMDSNKDCVMGLFVSMNTPIANISNPFHIDWLADKRPLVYISNMSQYDGKYLLDVVKSLVDIIQHYSVDDCDSNLQDKIERTAKSLELSVNKLGSIIKNIRLFRKQNNDNLTSLEDNVKCLKDEVANSLAVLTGKLVEDDILETPIGIEPVVPRKRGKKATSSSAVPTPAEHAA